MAAVEYCACAGNALERNTSASSAQQNRLKLVFPNDSGILITTLYKHSFPGVQRENGGAVIRQEPVRVIQVASRMRLARQNQDNGHREFGSLKIQFADQHQKLSGMGVEPDSKSAQLAVIGRNPSSPGNSAGEHQFFFHYGRLDGNSNR